MKTHLIKNGSISLILTPENEIERLLLDELFRTPVDVQAVEKIQVLNTALVDSILITGAKGNG